jgi:hypothetical protein
MRIDLETAHLGIVQAARDNLISAIKHRRDLVQATSDSVSELFALSAWAPGTNSDSVASAVTNGAVYAAFEMGANLDSVAHGILLGAIGSDPNQRAPLLDIIRQTSHGTVRAIAALNGDVDAAVHGLMDAAGESAHARGLDREHAVSAARDGAARGEAKSEMVQAGLTAPRELSPYHTDEDLVFA